MWATCGPAGGRTFLSTLSLRRATSSVNTADQEARFLSTLSLRRATAVTTLGAGSVRDFYPRSPCGERPGPGLFLCSPLRISIHALLAESDHRHTACRKSRSISIHALLAESDLIGIQLVVNHDLFLSTLSLRRATLNKANGLPGGVFLSTLSLRRATLFGHNVIRAFVNFYPRSPCGERLYPYCKACKRNIISIHALLAESDVSTKNGR